MISPILSAFCPGKVSTASNDCCLNSQFVDFHDVFFSRWDQNPYRDFNMSIMKLNGLPRFLEIYPKSSKFYGATLGNLCIFPIFSMFFHVFSHGKSPGCHHDPPSVSSATRWPRSPRRRPTAATTSTTAGRATRKPRSSSAMAMPRGVDLEA